MDMIYIWVPLFLAMGGFIHGFVGFGAMLLALPLLTLVLDIKTVIPLGALMGLTITVLVYWRMRHQVDWNDLWPLFIGALPGIVVGGLLAKVLSHHALSLILGISLICYAAYRIFGYARQGVLKAKVWGYFFGFISGLLGGTLVAGGPPVVVYASLREWSGNRIKATLQAFFLVSDLVIAITHAVVGLTTGRVLSLFALSLVFICLGTGLGLHLYGRVSERIYIKIMLVALAAMGVMMIWRA